MICHIIEIILLLAILAKLGMNIESPKNNWESLILIIGIVFVMVVEYCFYNNDKVDYDKISNIIKNELRKERKYANK